MQGVYDNIIELIFILLHFLVFALNYEIMKKKLMHPSVLFSLVWFIILLLHFIFRQTLLDELAPLKFSTFVVFFVGVISFSFGAFLQTTVWQKKHNIVGLKPIYEDFPISLLLRFILISIIFIVLPFYIKASYQLFISSQIENFIVGLRKEVIYGDEDIGPWNYIGTLSYVTFGFNLIAYYKKRNKLNLFLVVISLVLSISYAILATGRLLYLILLAIYTGISFIYNKSFSIYNFIKWVGVFMIFFIVMGTISGKGGDTDSTFKQNIEPAAQSTAIYLVSSLNSLDYSLNDQFLVTYSGNYTLRFFLKIGQKLGIVPRAKVADALQEFVFVPYPTNIYTMYYKYIKDFGKIFAWSMVFFYGLLHSFLYNKAVETRQIRFAFYYSLMLFPLLLSFFDDEYMFLISMWIQIIIVIEVIIRLNAYLMRNSKKMSEI